MKLSKIKSITKKEIVPVYDIIEVEDNNNFIANGLVTHNSSEDWNKKESKALKKKLAEVRTKHLLFILCFPLKIQKVDKTYLDAFTNYWIDIFGRGIGSCYVKDKNPSQDAWRIKDFAKVGSYTEFTYSSKVVKTLKKHPNFWQIVKFPKPPKHIYDKYLAVRERNVYDEDSVFDTVTGEDINNALLVLSLRDIMMHDGSLSMNRIVLHIKNEYDINISKKDVTAAVEDAKQLITKVRQQVIKE